jgi:hypothetical protein
MPLWGNRDLASGNQKPVFANTSNATSNSTINGTRANTAKYYGNMYGVSATETQNAFTSHISAHAGWISQKIGTGPISRIEIATRGTGINTAGFLLVTDGSPLKQGANLNISYTIANTLNLLQSSSSNSTLNGINTITIVSGGDGWSNIDPSYITVKVNQSNTTQPTFTLTAGGRAGRINYETIVAMGSITDDDPRDNTYFTGV